MSVTGLAQVDITRMRDQLFFDGPERNRRVMRDAILDRTPLLQKVVGESSPGEIIAQLAAIDEAEDRFTALRAAT